MSLLLNPARRLELILCGLLLLASGALAAQTTSWDVTNDPQMFLDNSIISSQTTGIRISAPSRNGTTVTFPNQTGGVLRVRQGSLVEDLSFTGATVNSSTKVVTLLGVTRNLCWNLVLSLTSCGEGIAFSKGATVELSTDARLFNFKANKDRANTFIAKNGVRFSGSGSLGQPTFATTADRDQQLGAAPASGSGLVACVVATGLCYDGLGGSWVARGSNATANATTLIAGKSELATVSDLSGSVATGDSGGPLVLGSDLVIRRSTGAINNRNKIVATNNQAVISGSLLPNLPINKFNGGTSASNTTFWRGDGTWQTSDVDVLIASGSYATKVLSNSAEQSFDRTYAFTANTLSAGNVYQVLVSGTGASAGSTNVFKLKAGSTVLCQSLPNAISNNNGGWRISAVVSVQSAGASGKLHTDCQTHIASQSGQAFTNSGSTVSVDTTASQTFQTSVTHTATQAGSYDYLTSFIIMKLTP